MNAKKTIGFIGLGTMGRPMAKNLLRAGYELVFFARRREVIDEFTALGGHAESSPAEVMRAAEVAITIVTADAQLKEVVLASEGLLAGGEQGKLLVDMSTVSPQTERELGEALDACGMSLVDAPVSGGPWGAEAATLTIMAGGRSDDFERVHDVFSTLGEHIFHVGSLGAGQTVKLANQLVAGGIMTLVGEAFVLAKAAGVDVHRLADVMAVSSGKSAVFDARGKKYVLADEFVPGFMTELMQKDVRLAVEMAAALKVPTPVAVTALEQYTAAMKLGHSRDDFAAVVKVCEHAAGMKIVES